MSLLLENETASSIPLLFDSVNDSNTYKQDFKQDFIASRKFADGMRDKCGDSVVITERNAVVYMEIVA